MADTDTLARSDIEEALANYNHHAKRQPHHRDCEAWHKTHARIDELLFDWELADA